MDDIFLLIVRGYKISFYQAPDFKDAIIIQLSKGTAYWNYCVNDSDLLNGMDTIFPLIIEEGTKKINEALLKGQLPED